MKHSRKMYLIPEEVMSLIQRNQIQTSPYVRPLTQLNQQMNDTLSNKETPDEIKANLYDQTLQQFLNIQEQREKHVPVVKIQGTNTLPITSTQLTSQLTPSVPQPQQNIPDAEILGTVPKKFKQQAQGLLNWVKKSPDVISWDEKGAVSVDGKPLEGSSISDLVNDLLRKRKGFQPQGRDQFAESLAKLNTPEDFIRNEDRRRLMALYKSGVETPTTQYITPQGEEKQLPKNPRKALKRGNVNQANTKARKGLNWISY